jgi:hypothetical protein
LSPEDNDDLSPEDNDDLSPEDNDDVNHNLNNDVNAHVANAHVVNAHVANSHVDDHDGVAACLVTALGTGSLLIRAGARFPSGSCVPGNWSRVQPGRNMSVGSASLNPGLYQRVG